MGLTQHARKHPIEVGTVLRSTHRADVEAKSRQHRVVTHVDERFVVVATKLRSGRVSESKIRRSPSGKVSGHEVVSHPMSTRGPERI